MQETLKTWTVALCIPSAHPDFEGHFPGFPLLPAVSQISLVKELVEQQLGFVIDCIELRRTKFKAMLRPGTELLVHLSLNGESEVDWQMNDNSQTYSLGHLQFRKA